ncbi:protein APEM9 [Rosa rugosa]|uniref:protein APEM9 n=1 Tax=Rosa rugosa TaxID=74645 RepID=UPI002B40E7B7|nr:protein APEM9 [Rosa rugosa]
MKREAGERQSNGSSSSSSSVPLINSQSSSYPTEQLQSGSQVEMGSGGPDPVTWEQIENSETYLVCSMYEEAASLASSILKRLSQHSEADDDELYDMLESAGMVLVQSLKQLGRTPEILNELKLSFASIPAIPVQVLLTGVCFYISEGHSLGIQEFLEVFLSGWSFVDGKCYVLVGKEYNADYTKRHDGHFVLGIDKYLEVVEVYTLNVLGTILNDVDLATSWVENAKIPEDRRQVLLRRLHSLHSIKATNASQGSFSSLLVDNYEDPSPEGRPKVKYPLNGDTAKKQAVLKLSKRLEPCLWWFRTITLKFGNTRLVISNGKIALGCLILLISYVLQRKRATLKRIVQRQALSMKNALVDLWQLAFSYQVNPLAAVQPLGAAARADQ